MVVSCAHNVGTGYRAPVKFWMVDLDSEMLFSDEQFDDKPLSFCKTEVCYVTLQSSYVSLKKKFVELEENLEACQKH